ncbi:collagen alpha-1(XII) chain-like isoform X1 [Mytilus californianus]|uniref:collagen alpha-1(XII) chain-like isoform X1 n=1 Tax=Mytilus californianus TaxID=6549 RepID=UPI0022451AE2|nr:collagen alpha-1(XII) chain-like isoform X1 [Mytilus californianus]
MVDHYGLIVLLIALQIVSYEGFTFTREKIDCLGNPDNGGEPCPTDTEFKEYRSKQHRTQATVNQTIQKFLPKKLKPSFSSSHGIVKRANSIALFRDLLIILDSSGSLGSRNFEIVKQQIGELLSLLCPLPDAFSSNSRFGNNRVALIQFSSIVKEEFDFDDNRNIFEIKEAIKSVPYLGGMTCTGDAFYKAIQMFNSSKGMRKGTKHEVLILTDGKANCGKPVSTVLPALHAKATVFALTIGSFLASGIRELASYVSKPTPGHIFAVEDFKDVQKLLNLIKAQIGPLYPCIPFDL